MRSSLFAAFIVLLLAILATFFWTSTDNSNQQDTMALPYIVVIGGSYVGAWHTFVFVFQS